MKHISKYLFIIALALSSYLYLPAKLSYGDRVAIKIATIEYPPLRSEKLPNGGFLPELTKILLNKLGYDASFHFKPFKRVYYGTRAGKHDAILGLWYRPFRENFFVYGPAVHFSQLRIVGRKGDVPSITGATFPSVRLGVTRGSSPPKEYLENASYVEKSTNEEINLKKLSAGRIDLAYVEKHLMDHLLRTQLQEYKGHFQVLSNFDVFEPLYIAFSKKSPFQSLAPLLEQEFSEFVNSNEYLTLLRKHGLKKSSVYIDLIQ